MQLFEKDGKINFIDENNVIVGYDMNQDCCETADWFISKKIESEIVERQEGEATQFREHIKNAIYKHYTFDKEFFKQLGSHEFKGLDSGEVAIFRLTADNKPDLYLHLYNCHNGYYGHGFEATIGGLKWQEGCL